jgi:hypothetical protein
MHFGCSGWPGFLSFCCFPPFALFRWAESGQRRTPSPSPRSASLTFMAVSVIVLPEHHYYTLEGFFLFLRPLCVQPQKYMKKCDADDGNRVGSVSIIFVSAQHWTLRPVPRLIFLIGVGSSVFNRLPHLASSRIRE